MDKQIFKKRIRLKDFNYKGQFRYFATICVDKNLGQCFNIANFNIVNKLIDFLRLDSEKYNFLVWTYCFMPDHLHLLVEGKDEYSDFKKFISSFKQKTGFYYSKIFSKKLWQTNYYEHILRKDEITQKVVRYILENPVRKNLVKDFKDYPFSGSFILDIKEIL